MVYLIREKGTHNIKIGSSKDPAIRLQDLQIGNPGELVLEMVLVYPGNSEVLEHEMHAMRSRNRIRGEWFKLTKLPLLMLIGRIRNAHKDIKVLTADEYVALCKERPSVFKNKQVLSMEYSDGSDADRVRNAFEVLKIESTGFISYRKIGALARVSEKQTKDAMYSLLLVKELMEFNDKIKGDG